MENLKINQFVPLLLGLILFIAEGVNYSQIGPFFPSEASANKNVSTTFIGVITGTFDAANFLTAIILAFFISPENQKHFFCGGALLSATCNGFFGVMGYIDGGAPFIIACTLIRTIMGTGASMAYSTGVPLLVPLYPKWSGRITGLIETSFGLGIIVGPVVGTVIYSLGGYTMPFLVAASTQIPIVLLCIFFLPNKAAKDYETSNNCETHTDYNLTSNLHETTEEESKHTFIYFVSHLAVLTTGSTLVFHSATTGFIDVALAPYLLEKFSVHGDTSGYYFLAFLAIYVLSLPLLGLLVDSGQAGKMYLASGSGAAGGFVMLALPALIPTLESKIWLLITLIILGAVNAAGYAAVYLLFEKLAYDVGFTVQSNAKLVAAALSNACFSSGRMLGSIIIGGVFKDIFGYYNSCLLLSGLFLTSSILCGYVLFTKSMLQKIYYPNEE